MSQTATTTHQNIRTLIDDLDPDARAISRFRMDLIVSAKVQEFAGRVHQHLQSVPTSIALVAGTYDYTVTGTPKSIRQVVLNSNGANLVPLALEDLNDRFKQDTAVGSGRGTPAYFALYETNTSLSPAVSADQTYKMRIGPTPVASDALDVYYSTHPGVNVGTYSGPAAGRDIPFTPMLTRALELACAATCVLMMDDDDLKRRKIPRSVAGVFQAQSDTLLREENWRQRVTRGLQPEILRRVC